MKPKFPLGQVVITANAAQALPQRDVRAVCTAAPCLW